MSEFTIPDVGSGVGEEVVVTSGQKELRTRRIRFIADPDRVWWIVRSVFRSLPDHPRFWWGTGRMKTWCHYYAVSRPKDYWLPEVHPESTGTVKVITPASNRVVSFDPRSYQWEVDFGERGSYWAATELKNLLTEKGINYEEEEILV